MDADPQDSLTAALDYIRRYGWAVFPVPPGTKKSYKSGRYGNNNPWGMTRSVESVEQDFKKWPEAGVGVPTGWVNGIFVVETDTLEGHGVDGRAGLRALEAEHGVLPETLMAESPTGSIHRYFAWPKPLGVDIRNSDGKLAPGVDVRGAGGMVIAPPTRTKKGRYRWLNDLPIADPPRWLVTLVERDRRIPRAHGAPRNVKRKPLTDDELRDLMEGIPNDLRTTWDDWNNVGMALYATTNGSSFGFEQFDQWSEKREDKYDPEKTEEKWAAYDISPPNNIGVGKLFYLAFCAQFEAEVEAVARLKEQGDWPETPVEDAFDDLTDGPVDDAEDDESDDDDVLLARRAPTIDPRAFYGPLEKIVTETTRESEATKVGVAAQIMAHASLTLRPFYNPLGNGKIPFNIYAVQVGPSGKGRKGTSAAIGDDFLGPALLRLAAQVRTRITFPGEDEDARAAAEAEVETTTRRLSWTRNLNEDREGEFEARLAELRADNEATAREIAKRKARLRATAPALRTTREHEKLIAAAQARRDDIARQIAVNEVELTEVREVLKDQAASLRQAQAAHDAALARLDGLPAPASPAPWLDLFASLDEGPVSARGVSSGEGLIELIRDPGRKQGPRGPVDDPGVANKCLFLNLDELGSVLAVIMRPGATLSSVLRTMWDCREAALINKNSPTRCKEPYVTMSASITPGELIGRLFDKRDAASSADNGLGNRLLYLWVQRDRLKARPLATPGLDAMMDAIAGNIFNVYESLKPEGAFLSTPIDFSAGAYARYEREYPRIANLKAAGRRAAKLIERLPVYLRKIAAILSVMNSEHEISEGALEAAIAWVEYAAGTVNAIATSAAERKNTRILAGDGETILAALKALGGRDRPVGSRELQRKTRLEKKRFDAAIVELMQQGPPPIVVSEEIFVSGHATRRPRAMLALNRFAEPEDEI